MKLPTAWLAASVSGRFVFRNEKDLLHLDKDAEGSRAVVKPQALGRCFKRGPSNPDPLWRAWTRALVQNPTHIITEAALGCLAWRREFGKVLTADADWLPLLTLLLPSPPVGAVSFSLS